MGNQQSRSSAAGGQQHQSGATGYFDFLALPPEVQTMMVGQLCPHCSIGDGQIASTEEARDLQRDLGSLARCSSHLLKVANSHRFHSFVMPPSDPDYGSRSIWNADPKKEEDISIAHRYHNDALPELLERLLNCGQLTEYLRFLSLSNFTLRYKAGVTKRRLRLFINGSRSRNLPVPDCIPALLSVPEHTTNNPRPPGSVSHWLNGELWVAERAASHENDCLDFDTWLTRLLLFRLAPRLERLMMHPEIAHRAFARNHPAASLGSVLTLGIPQSTGDVLPLGPTQAVQMERLLLSFSNLREFHNEESLLAWNPIMGKSPPSGPNLRRLALLSEQPGRLHHATQVLREFPRLEQLHFHRRPCSFWQGIDDDFSNTNVFDAVHHTLRALRYTSTLITQFPDPDDFHIDIDCFEERQNSDVPHLRNFTRLERLEIDQALLGPMSTLRHYIDAPIGPQYPNLDYKLPESLCKLTIKSVYDWPTLAAQLVPLAIAKHAGGQFPFLKDIFIVIIQTGTVTYNGTWPPEIPLHPNQQAIIISTGMLLREAGINLWVSTEEIGPCPVALDQNGSESLITIRALVWDFPSV